MVMMTENSGTVDVVRDVPTLWLSAEIVVTFRIVRQPSHTTMCGRSDTTTSPFGKFKGSTKTAQE